MTHHSRSACTNGGKAPLDLGMTKFAVLPCIQPVLQSKANWLKLKNYGIQPRMNLKKLTEATPNSAEYIVAYNSAYKSNNATMKAMNEAVGLICSGCY